MRFWTQSCVIRGLGQSPNKQKTSDFRQGGIVPELSLRHDLKIF